MVTVVFFLLWLWLLDFRVRLHFDWLVICFRARGGGGGSVSNTGLPWSLKGGDFWCFVELRLEAVRVVGLHILKTVCNESAKSKFDALPFAVDWWTVVVATVVDDAVAGDAGADADPRAQPGRHFAGWQQRLLPGKRADSSTPNWQGDWAAQVPSLSLALDDGGRALNIFKIFKQVNGWCTCCFMHRDVIRLAQKRSDRRQMVHWTDGIRPLVELALTKKMESIKSNYTSSI